MLVDQINPRTIILEEVPAYLKSEIGIALLMALKRMGYKVETKLMSGVDYGQVTTRKRAVIVATMNDFIKFPEPESNNKTMADILEPVGDEEYFNRDSKAWFFNRWDKADATGTNFKSQVITPESKTVQAITKRYFAIQAGNPVVKHPTKEGFYRLFTLNEVKKIMGLDKSYYLGESKTFAGEVMGQGVLVNMFKKVIEANSLV